LRFDLRLNLTLSSHPPLAQDTRPAYRANGLRLIATRSAMGRAAVLARASVQVSVKPGPLHIAGPTGVVLPCCFLGVVLPEDNRPLPRLRAVFSLCAWAFEEGGPLLSHGTPFLDPPGKPVGPAQAQVSEALGGAAAEAGAATRAGFGITPDEGVRSRRRGRRRAWGGCERGLGVGAAVGGGRGGERGGRLDGVGARVGVLLRGDRGEGMSPAGC
jgi:hypothetical protein